MRRIAAAGAFVLFALPLSAAPNAAPVFANNCAKCHGTDGKAHTETGRKEEIADFTAPSWKAKNSNAAIKDVITYGAVDNPRMKAYKDKLSEAEIDALVAYIRGLK